MQLDSYHKAFSGYFESTELRAGMARATSILSAATRIFFIGNGGSNAICSHMMEDYMKIAGKQTLSFSDPALITCFANDYGYQNALAKWIEFNFQTGDVLVAISSSGESENIINAVLEHQNKGGKVITLSGFTADNTLSRKGDVNMVTPEKNYGIVECFHQVILHAILDDIAC